MAVYLIFTNLISLIFLQTLQCLQQNAKERSESSANATSTTSYTLPSTTTKMSMQELDELRKKLGNVTSGSNAPQVSLYHSSSVLPWPGVRYNTRIDTTSDMKDLVLLLSAAVCRGHQEDAEGTTQQEEPHPAQPGVPQLGVRPPGPDRRLHYRPLRPCGGASGGCW